MKWSPHTLFQARKDVLCSVLPDDEAVLLHLDAGLYFGLNPVAAFNWKLLEKPQTLESLINATLDSFEIDPKTCEEDLIDLLESLKRQNLLEIVK